MTNLNIPSQNKIESGAAIQNNTIPTTTRTPYKPF